MVEKIGAKLVTTEEAIKSSNIIVMAVPKNFYERQPLHLLEGKTVIGKKHALKKYDQFGPNSYFSYYHRYFLRSCRIKYYPGCVQFHEIFVTKKN